MSANDIPGYLQGFIFSDAPEFYDSTANRFLDQSPYSGLDNNHLDISVGTPSFQTIGSGKGVTLNNTMQGSFLCPIAWEGSLVAIMKPNMGTNGNLFPVIFGAATSITSNGHVRLIRVTPSEYRHAIYAASAVTDGLVTLSSDTTAASVFSVSQETRRAYGSGDGINVHVGNAVPDNGTGVGAFSGGTMNAEYGFRARFGNVSSIIGDTSATANTMVMCELHFFAGNLLVDPPAALASFIAERKAFYGIA